jgi:hypothetical protein
MNTNVEFQMVCHDCGSLTIKIEKFRRRISKYSPLLRSLRRFARDHGCVERPSRPTKSALPQSGSMITHQLRKMTNHGVYRAAATVATSGMGPKPEKLSEHMFSALLSIVLQKSKIEQPQKSRKS